ncbi:MAG TPA: alpha/beta fold hydrolase [bacterium]|nr:alpha/beta fold hydrolase [bacterium]
MTELFKNFLKAFQGRAGKSWESIQSLGELNPRYLSVLNGIVGDALAEKKSRLAISMSLIGEVKGGRLCILVHGLCDSEETWRFAEDPSMSYGSLLQSDFGYAPLYLRYNTGLHISTNGRALAKLLTEIEENLPGAIQELIFIGHSMGGLVVRSACHYGQEAGANWARRVKKIFFLGTPHLGTDYEKIGNLTATILRLIPNPVTWGIASLGNRRSAGIKDLRFGYLVDEDWQDQDPDALWRDNRHAVPLLEQAEHYLIAGSLAKESENFLIRYFGDGLVPSRSAAGQSLRKKKSIPFAAETFTLVKGVSHSALARHPKVYEQIKPKFLPS